MEPEPKRRKTYQPPPRRNVSSVVAERERAKTSIETFKLRVTEPGGANMTIHHAKNLAVTQAQHDGSTGNFRIFDSPFGNFLVPVIPSRDELAG